MVSSGPEGVPTGACAGWHGLHNPKTTRRDRVTAAPEPGSLGWPGSWNPFRMSGWARRTSRQGMQISTVNRPSISLKGPVKVPQKEQCGPTPHPRLLELVFE